MSQPTRGRVIAGAGVVVRDDGGRVLLVRRRIDGSWGCPGGHLEFGESWADTARREFREETGGDVELIGLLGIYSDPADQVEPSGTEEPTQVVGVMFEGRLMSGLGEHRDDVTDVAWFGADGLPSPLWPPDVSVIQDALSDSPRPFIR